MKLQYHIRNNYCKICFNLHFFYLSITMFSAISDHNQSQPSMTSTSSSSITMFYSTVDHEESQPSTTSTSSSSSSTTMFYSTVDQKESQSSTSSSSIELSQPCRHFEYSEILLATDNFDESLVIGRGGFGKVYKGNVINGSTVSVAAIKRLDPMSSQGASEFWPEVEMLSNFRHPHLVSLFGYCNHEKEMILVYEYMANGTLADHLHKLGTPLSWLQRLNICIGAARGLHYLHTGTGTNTWAIHRDVKSSNILLHEKWDWDAKISDFGLSKKGPTNQPVTYVETDVKGTFGYLDPDYSFTGRLTRKSDVYAFGVVLLEVLCRKPALDLSLDEEQQNLARWAQESIKKGNLKHIIDSGIRDQISLKSLKEFVRIVGGCLHSKQKERPTMAEVVFSLESVLTLQWKMSSSLQPSHITILGRMVDKFSFTSIIGKSGKTRFGRTVVSRPSNRENFGISYFTERSQSCRKFEFPEILLATNNFDESLVVGHGGFGKVYKGNIINASTVAVAAIKRLDSMSSQGATEFSTEVEMLSKLHHDHVVSLFGYCNHEKEMIIVYEYMPYGTLEDHLHKLSTPLSWVQRLKICIGAACGLDYLHTGTGIESGVIHRDVKSSNILLHDTWAAKISDFGLSRIGPINQPSTYVNTFVKGTFGYLDPNYYTTGRLTRKSDVYSFGVVLLEVLCRKRAMDKSLGEEEWGLVPWAQDYIKEGRLKHIVDSDIRGQISTKCLKQFVRIAQRCLLIYPKQRPTMSEVVFGLDSILTLQEKTNSSLQAVRKTIFGTMVDMLPFPSNVDNSALGDPKLSSNNNGYSRSARNMFLDTREVHVDFGIPNSSLKIFKFPDLEKATRNFSQDLVLGEGAFGKVFLGWVNKKTFAPSRKGVGIPVAVKRRSTSSTRGHAEWLVEVSLLGPLANSNIINLLGYCNDEQEYLLVYEYMHNRSLDRFLYKSVHVTAKPLSWRTRLIIMIGVARGLNYLHSSKCQIINRDIRSSSILVDQDFNAKLGSFGLARFGPENGKTHVTTRIVGSGAIAAPEYISTGHLSVKCDIYSFGVVLLETLTGLQVMAIMERYETNNLAHWASLILEKTRKLKLIIDPCLDHNYPHEGAFALLTLASKCLANKPKDRPSSEEVLLSLEQIHAANEY